MRTLTKKEIDTLKIENLEGFNDWDKRTVDLRIGLGGSGNMWGGSGKGVIVTLHGDNSVSKTGTFSINGEYKHYYNISRGANGEDSSTTTYFSFSNESDNPTYKITVSGSSGGSEVALDSILRTKHVFLKDDAYKSLFN